MTLGTIRQKNYANEISRHSICTSGDLHPLQMNPSEQMTYVLHMLSRKYEMVDIVYAFRGDENLAKLLITSLKAFGFVVKKDDRTDLTEKGKGRIKSSALLHGLAKPIR